MASKYLVKAKEYKVKDGDTRDSIAAEAGISWGELARFNWGTDDPDEVNKSLRNKVGCLKKDYNDKDYSFSKDDDPGIIYFPEEFPKKNYADSQTHNIKVKVPVVKSFKPADCVVNFRPADKWNGEYGFDWMREGDYPVCIGANQIFADLKFENVMGRYWVKKKDGTWIIQPDGNAYKGDRPFDKDPAMFKSLETEYQKKDIDLLSDASKKCKCFYTSYLNLFLNDKDFKLPRKITMQAFIKVEAAPEQLIFKYDSNYLDISPKVLPKSTQNINIDITCTKELDDDKEIEVRSIFRDDKNISRDILVGKMIVLKNSKANRKTVKVLLVKVLTPALSSMGEARGNPDGNLGFVERILQQALISPMVDKIDLDFTKNDKLSKDFTDNYAKGSKLLSDGLKNSGKGLHIYCLDELAKEIKDFNTKYSKHLKAFYFGVDSAEGLYGYSSGYSVVVFGNAVESTAVHEWLHSLGLPHTFDGSGKFTYQYPKTENIMDYTHHLATNAATQYYKKSRISLYHWQWGIAHGNSLTQTEK